MKFVPQCEKCKRTFDTPKECSEHEEICVCPTLPEMEKMYQEFYAQDDPYSNGNQNVEC